MISIRSSKISAVTICVILLSAVSFAQPDLAGAAATKLALERLKVLGSVLMIAAHPDDENTAVLAYFARGRNVETSYLSLTRGEGGQNYIGSEQGDKLGVIRTEELLAARRIDGAQQFFTQAIDFGFTKTADEAIAKWGGHELILSDIVWTIRRLRPDVILLRFSGTPRDGHGQHQASAILGKEAFTAAADPKRFPEQLKWVKPWQARRLLWNVFSFTAEQEREAAKLGGRVELDAGEYNPVLGYSYGEIAGMSRSMHRSQAMGSGQRRGSMKQFFVTVAGEPAVHDAFDGIDTTWNRVPGGDRVLALVAEADRNYAPDHPERSIPALLKAREIVAGIDDHWAHRKLRELDETIALCAGVWVDASADRAAATPGSELPVTLTMINRGPVPVRAENVKWSGTAVAKPETQELGKPLVDNVPSSIRINWNIPAGQTYTQPYWLTLPRNGREVYPMPSQSLEGLPENPALLEAQFSLSVAGATITLNREVIHRYVDRARGELTRPVEIVPAVSIGMPENALVFANGASRRIEVPLKSNGGPQTGSLQLSAPDGWRISPESANFSLAAGEQKVLTFAVTPPGSGRTMLTATAKLPGESIASGLDVIDYEHIPPQTLFPAAQSKAVALPVKNLATQVGYIMGAGDQVPEALRQIGCEVTLLSPDDLAKSDLSRFDAIVTGVRAWNVRPDLKANRQRLLDYMQSGGTLVVQYNVLEGGFGRGNPGALDGIGPYPIRISRDRVTVEEAPVKFPNPASPLLHSPNEITEADFDGWIQERGLYFASQWDAKYSTLFESHDPGENPLEGGTLVAKYGKGAYVFSAYSWFRELPAGVPGAFRIFANLLSAGKVLANAR
jgi:LmbE family N-acetylglucosaminyl deacetylase